MIAEDNRAILIRAERALLHPVWLLALGLLLLNDHVLKHAMPGVFTGKLSDVVGLVVAPALLAALLRARSRGALLAAHLAIGAVFAAINLSPEAAGAFEALMALGPLPWAITVDPTDLLALPALFASWRLILVASARPAPAASRPLTQAALALGLFASMATSPPPGPFNEPPRWTSVDLLIGAQADQRLLLRIRPLVDTAFLDCDEVTRSPSTVLARELFGPAVAWQVDPDDAAPVHGDGFSVPFGSCFAALVDGTLFTRVGGVERGEPIPMALLYWTSTALPAAMFETTADARTRGRVIGVERAATGPRFTRHSAVFAAPSTVREAPVPGCEPAPPGALVAWETPLPLGGSTITRVISGPDGCHQLTLADPPSGPRRWYLCTNTPTLPFTEGDAVVITAVTHGQRFRPVEGVQLLGVSVGEGKRVVVARGGDLAPWGSGDWSAFDRPECGPVHDACGNYVVSQELGFLGRDRTTQVGWLPHGVGAVTLETGTVLVHRAARVPVGDAACLPDTVGADGRVFDSVFITPALEE